MELLDLLAWDWATIGKTALGAGFGTAAMTGILSLYRDHRQKKSLAAYMAMRLAVTLEAYAYACYEFISANENAPHYSQEDEFPAWTVRLPELPPYPDDIDGWRAIDRELAGKCLNLRNRIASSQGSINSTIEFDMYGLEDELNEQASGRGIEAWELAAALRSRHNIEAPDMIWDFISVMRDCRRHAAESKEKNSKARSEFLSELGAAERMADPAS